MQLVGKGYSVVSKDIRVEFDKFICLKDAIKHIRKYKNRRNVIKLFKGYALIMCIVLGKRVKDEI